MVEKRKKKYHYWSALEDEQLQNNNHRKLLNLLRPGRKWLIKAIFIWVLKLQNNLDFVKIYFVFLHLGTTEFERTISQMLRGKMSLLRTRMSVTLICQMFHTQSSNR